MNKISTINYKSKIDELKNSLLFNLSLSSKELFHSNFIAWVCNNYSSTFGKILDKKLGLDLKNKTLKSTKREKKNIDLIIEFDSAKLIIENKVKSIPNQQQLKDYKKNHELYDRYVLLTLIEPKFKMEEWILLTYKDFSVLLEELLPHVPDSYHQAIIRDYINFISTLSELSELIKSDFENRVFNFYGEKYKLFEEIRLHDLYIKQIYNHLIYELHEFLSSKLDIKVVVGEKYIRECFIDKIVINQNFVRGKGVINIDYARENSFHYGIMLDGKQYVQYIHGNDKMGVNTEELAKKFYSINKWFKFNFSECEVYPNKKEFNSFGPNMKYRYIKILETQTFSSLFEQIYNDLQYIIKSE